MGIPEHIYSFPENYGGEKCGLPITEEQMQEVAELSNVLENTDDFLINSFFVIQKRSTKIGRFFISQHLTKMPRQSVHLYNLSGVDLQ